MRLLSLFAIAAVGALFVQAQEQEARFTSDVRLVNVEFSVADASGALRSGLNRDDFEVYENGVKQEIRYFSRDENTPLTLALILDRSGSQSDLEADNMQTAVAFLRRILRPQDRALLVRIKLLRDYTNDARDLELAIIDAGKIYDESKRIGPAAGREGGTAVNDTVFWLSRERFNDATGRKGMLMIGDGEENSSVYGVKVAIEELQRTGVLFYGLNNGGNTGKRKHRVDVMPYLADGSGGREFHAGDGSWKEAFAQIEAELRGLYSLAYTPSEQGKAGAFRKIEIKAKDSALRVRSRPGYVAR